MKSKISSTSVSRGIRKTLYALKNDQPLIEKSIDKKFAIKIANSLEKREFVLNLNLIYTSVTDKCFFKKLLIRLGAKEREKFFDSNGKLISPSKENNFADKLRDFENQFITLPIKEKQ